jgi:hypothetical protein
MYNSSETLITGPLTCKILPIIGRHVFIVAVISRLGLNDIHFDYSFMRDIKSNTFQFFLEAFVGCFISIFNKHGLGLSSIIC